MNFYDSHFSSQFEVDNDLYEIVEYKNQSDIINNRAIYGDIVLVEKSSKKVVRIERKGERKKLVGIIYLDSTTKYGTSSSGNLLYMCKPLDRNYPSFYVASSKRERYKMYVRFEFMSWIENQRLPLGNVIDYIGKVGEEEVEYEMLRYLHGLDFPRMKPLTIGNREEDETEEVEYNIFSIDPKGSKDIDDAFSYCLYGNEGIIEIGIHIASPTVKFDNIDIESKDGVLRNLIENRMSTVYLPHKKYNILPNEYADDLCSLLEGKKRRCLSILLRFCIETRERVSCEIRETVVKNRKNYNYDEIDVMIKRDRWEDGEMREMYMFSRELFEIEKLDSHKWIEKWMIMANNIIGEEGIKKFGERMILRVCEGNINNNREIVENEELNRYLMRYEMKGAEYKYYNEDEIMRHNQLDIDKYTHFTSPIRRGIDFYVHLLFRGSIDGDFRVDLGKVNERMKRMKRLDRDMRRMVFIFRGEVNDEIKRGYVVEKDEEGRWLRVYIPEYDIEEKVMLKDRYGYSGCSEGEVEIEREYGIYEEVRVRVYLFRKEENFRNKIRVQIV